MNHLTVGTDKRPILHLLKKQKRFLLVDDGELIDALSFPKNWDIEYFDVTKHHFNPLRNLDHKGARALTQAIYDAYPQGENTLTVRNGKRALTKLLLKADCLDELPRSKKDDIAEANNTIDDLLISSVLSSVLCGPINFSPDGILLVRLNRAELGDLDAFVIANALLLLYDGQIVIPDMGFYACPFHTQFIRQKRLIAGVNFLGELSPKMRNNLLLIPDKIGSHCTPGDAEILAGYTQYRPHTNAYNEFIDESIE